MAENKSGSVILWVALGGLALIGLCCVGVGGVGYWAYQRAEAEQRAIVEGWNRQEEEARRLQEEARREQDRARQDVELASMLRPPPPLSISPGRTSDRRTRHVTALVTRVEGNSGVSVGDTCEYEVTVEDSTRDVGYWCRALVECSGVRLYGTDTPRRNGFFPCELVRRPFGVAGEDRDTTQGQGDPFYQIDTRLGRMVVMDDATSMVGDAFRVEATITQTR